MLPEKLSEVRLEKSAVNFMLWRNLKYVMIPIPSTLLKLLRLLKFLRFLE